MSWNLMQQFKEFCHFTWNVNYVHNLVINLKVIAYTNLAFISQARITIRLVVKQFDLMNSCIVALGNIQGKTSKF